MLSNLTNIIARRDLLKSLILSEFQSSTAQMRLGWLWWLLDPLLLMGVYWGVMVVILGRGNISYQPYWIFLFCGLIAWKHLAESAAKATNVLRARDQLIKSVSFPTIVLPIAIVFSGFGFFLFGMVVLLVLTLSAALLGLLVEHSGSLLPLIQLPGLMILQLIIVTAIVLPLACLGALIRDLSPFISHLLRIAYYLSPGLYGIDLIQRFLMDEFGPTHGSWLFKIYMLNPFAILISGYRDSIFYGKFMPPYFWVMLLIEAVLLLFIGYRIYLYYDRRVIKFL
jgi:ABC-type polysaccharide/polyol phosphate export permease